MRDIAGRPLILCVLVVWAALPSPGQATSPTTQDRPNGALGSTVSDATGEGDQRRRLREQREEVDRLRAMLINQVRAIDDLRRRIEEMERAAGTAAKEDRDVSQEANPVTCENTPSKLPNNLTTSGAEARTESTATQVRRTGEALAKQLGSIHISGDIRLRYETLFGGLNALPNSDNPLVSGNKLSSRHRGRLRARLSLRGQIGERFDWGLRLATGSYTDAISTNQTLTDFYTHKPFALDQAFISYQPRRVPGLRLQGGKFEPPWACTELTVDGELRVEGVNESYSRDFKNSTLKNLTFVAWQLPFLERSSGFVRDDNGKVSEDQSRRAGRDLALYGGQLRARLEPTSNLALTLSASDLYFSGTQFITPVQFFGNHLQLPVTLTLPAAAGSPPQTLSSSISIPRDLFVAGGAGLGLSTATNNAVNGDGRLASGFNLVDVIGRLDLSHSKRFPVMLVFNFVTNTQARAVSVASPRGAHLLLRNKENNGYWAELQAGRTAERGDVQFGYTFMRIEKDAVLTPFNFSDLAQQSDVRAHRFTFAYAADSRVTLSLTGIISERPNGLLGIFAATPPGSLNRPTVRLQLDTVFRF